MQQSFRFEHGGREDIRDFLRSLTGNAALEERAADFFVFTALPGRAAFSIDFEIVEAGLRSVRHGAYFEFIGVFVEASTGRYGAVTIEDSCN
jgi:hypothetical protein